MAKVIYKNGVTSVIQRFVLYDSTSTTGGRKTALTFSSGGLIISTIADNEASATAYTAAGSTIETITTLGTFAAPTATKCRFKEVDATNHPGLYEVQIADARWAVTSARSIVITVQCTGAVTVDLEIQLSAADLNDATALGVSRLDAAVSSRMATYTQPTGFLAATFPSGTVASTTNITAGTITTTTNVTNGVTVTTNNDKTGYRLLTEIRNGTAQAGAAGTITLDAGASATASLYNGNWITLTGGTGAGQSRLITAYTSGKVATVSPAWTTAPDATSVFTIVPAGDVLQVDGNVTGNVSGSVASVTGAVGSVSGNVGGNVVGTVASVTGSVGSVTGAVGSVTGNVGGSVVGDVQGKVLGGGASALTGTGVRAVDGSGNALGTSANQTTIINDIVALGSPQQAGSAVTLPANPPAGFLVAASFGAGSLNGKGDWVLSTSYVSPTTAVAETTPAVGASMSEIQLLYEIRSLVAADAVSGGTLSTNTVAGAAKATYTLTLDGSGNPTGITRAT